MSQVCRWTSDPRRAHSKEKSVSKFDSNAAWWRHGPVCRARLSRVRLNARLVSVLYKTYSIVNNLEIFSYLSDVEQREEGGTPAVVESVRAGIVFQLKDSLASKAILQRDAQLSRFLENVFCYGNSLLKILWTGAHRRSHFTKPSTFMYSSSFAIQNGVAALVFGVTTGGFGQQHLASSSDILLPHQA